VRLFVAVQPSPEARAHAAAAVAAARARHPDPVLRWIPAERWHLTLAFYGEVPEEQVPGTVGMVERRVRGARALRLVLRGAGHFSRRALWLGVDGEVAGLRRLARAVAFERRPYRPHLTVARLRGDAEDAARAAAASLADYEGPPWQAEAVHLVRSRLGPHPSYDDVAAWALD